MPQVASTIIEMVIFKFENNLPLYLLLHRQKNERLYPNIWQILSGSIEKGEKAIDAARRELTEETQLAPIAFWVVPYITNFYDSNKDIMNLCPVFAAQVSPGSNPKISEEHDDFLWLPFEQAKNYPVWHGQQEALRIVHEYIVGGKKASELNKIQL